MLTIRIVNPLVRDLHPLENLAHLNFVIFSKFVYLNFSTTLRWVCPAHAGHTHCIKAITGEVIKSRSVHLLNFGDGGQVIALKSATAFILDRLQESFIA